MPVKENVKAEATISDDLSQEQVERIRQRAYELYEARGRVEGHDVDDWLQAEAETTGVKPAMDVKQATEIIHELAATKLDADGARILEQLVVEGTPVL